MTEELKPKRKTATAVSEQPVPFESADEKQLEAEEVFERAKEIFQDDLIDPQAVERLGRGLLPPKPRGLHAKLAEMLEEVGYLQKTGQAPLQMGGFRFVEAAEAADRVRRSLSAKGISMLPEFQTIVDSAQYTTKSGSNQFLVTIKTTWVLTDSETGETATFESFGSGQDGSDKALPKAQTNAMKYAILMGWLIPTGEDPERFVNEEIAPIVIESSNLPGVQQGGKQTQATQPQLDAILRMARQISIDPDDFKTIIEGISGSTIDPQNHGLPMDWDELVPPAQRDVIRDELAKLTFDQAAGVLQALQSAANS